MTRHLSLFASLLLASLLSGCGEPERSHFVPASTGTPGVSSTDRRAGDKVSRETTVPKNIPMH